MNLESPLTLSILAVLVLSPGLTFFFRQQQPWVPAVGVTLQAVSLFALTCLAIALDRATALSATWRFCAAFIVGGTVIAGYTFLRYQIWFSLSLGVLFVASILVLHFWDVTPVKPYQRFYAAIQNGMTEAEVLSILHREFSEHGRFAVPVSQSEPGRLSFILDPKARDFNGEGITLTLQDGRVAGKQYTAD